jgi:hypothetical protein
MTEIKDNKEKKRPSRMVNIAFPSAKYGLYLAIVIIVISMYLIFFG